MNQCSNLKGVSSQSHQIYVPTFKAAGGGNTPHVGEGYYHALSCGALACKIFGLPVKVENTLIRAKIEKYTRAPTSTSNNERSFASTPKPWG
jgi:hypothetical protein